MFAMIKAQIRSIRTTRGHLPLDIFLLSLLCSGCGGDPQLETIHGLQEENKVLKQQVADLQAGSNSNVTTLRKQYEDQLATKVQLHREKVAQLEKEISDVRLDLGAIERERLTLKELLDQQPRLDDAKKVRAGTETMVLVVMLGLVLLVLGYLVFRHRATCDRLHLLTAQQVAELRHSRSGQ
jgi:cytochrome c-type biogenesis protein CcmH/NrfG